MLPTEFIEMFEKQYPKLNYDYKLPSSLSKCPSLEKSVRNIIASKKTIEVKYMDEAGITYDILNKKYYSLGNERNPHDLTQKGYDIIFEKLYKIHAKNLSPRSFAYILDDLAAINPVVFKGLLVAQEGNFFFKKAIAMQKSWMEFCLNYDLDFKMDFTDYNKFIDELGQSSSNDSGSKLTDTSNV